MFFLKKYNVLNVSIPQEEGSEQEEANVVKSCPVRVTTAASLEVIQREKPESKQLILGMDYDIDVVVKDPDGRKIHPSEVRRIKSTRHDVSIYLSACALYKKKPQPLGTNTKKLHECMYMNAYCIFGVLSAKHLRFFSEKAAYFRLA